jgi:predicted N-acyltransferase
MSCDQVRIVESIRTIDPYEWSSLQISSPYVSYGWLATVEATALDPPSLRYVLHYTNGVLSGAAVCQKVTVTRRNRLNNVIMGRLAATAGRLGISFEPALILGAYGGYGSTFLHSRHLSAENSADITRSLLSTIQDYADEQGLSIAICNLSDRDKELRAILKSSSFCESINGPVARLESQWTSFEDYLRAVKRISKGTAKDIRRERNRLLKSRTKISRLHLTDLDPGRMVELLSYNYRKHNNPPFPFNESFFNVLASYMPNDAVCYGAWKSGELVAFSLMLKADKEAWGIYYGCDYDACGRDGTYFNIVFNLPIEEIIEQRLDALNYGLGLHELKQRRGCTIMRSYIYYKASTRLRHLLLRPAFVLRSLYFARKTGLADDKQHDASPVTR